MPYAARRRQGEPIATSFAESAVDEIIALRIAKAQQMRRSRATVRPFLNGRSAVLNDTLDDGRCCMDDPSIINGAAYARSTFWAQNRPNRFVLISFTGLLQAIINFALATPVVNF